MEDSYAGIQVLASELNDFGRIRRQVANSMQQSRAKANPLKVDKFKRKLHLFKNFIFICSIWTNQFFNIRSSSFEL